MISEKFLNTIPDPVEEWDYDHRNSKWSGTYGLFKRGDTYEIGKYVTTADDVFKVQWKDNTEAQNRKKVFYFRFKSRYFYSNGVICHLSRSINKSFKIGINFGDNFNLRCYTTKESWIFPTSGDILFDYFQDVPENVGTVFYDSLILINDKAFLKTTIVGERIKDIWYVDNEFVRKFLVSKGYKCLAL